MGTIQPSAILPMQQKLPVSSTGVDVLESKIAVAAAEISFYQKLLSWLLYSCQEEKRPVVEAFNRELVDFRSNRLAVLIEGLGNLKNGMQEEIRPENGHSDLAHLFLYFNNLEGALQSLKSRIQARFSDLTHVCIW